MQLNYQPCDIVRRIMPLRCYPGSFDFSQKRYKAAKIDPALFFLREGETEQPFVNLVIVGDALELRDRRDRDWRTRWVAQRTETGLYIAREGRTFDETWLGDGEKYSVRQLYSMLECPKRIPVVDERFAVHLMEDLQRYEAHRRREQPISA